MSPRSNGPASSTAIRPPKGSADKYRSIVENAVFGVFQTKREGRFLSANPALARMLGYDTPDELIAAIQDIGQQIHVDPDRRGELLRLLEENDAVFGFQCQAKRKDGSVIWVSLTARTVRDAAGEVVGFEGTAEDISERKRREDADAFLAEASDLLAATSLDHSMTLASLARLAVPRLADWCAIDVLGEEQSLQRVAVVHPDRAKVELAQELEARYPFDPDAPWGVARVLRTGESEFFPEIPDSLLVEVARDSDDLMTIRGLGMRSAMTVPLVARGRTLGALTLVSAESGRRYTQADLELAVAVARRAGLAIDNARLYAELQRANEAKDEFLGLISHELRTPITAIFGGARMLRSRGDRLDGESKAEILADIEAESERLYRMIENLLAVARVELGQKVPTEPVLIQRVIRKVATAFRQRRPRRRFRVQARDSLDPVAADPTYVEQVLNNLLSNADKYSPQGKPVAIRARATEQGEVVTSVLDRGPGIESEEAALIFERFYRSGRASRRAKGVGLGLTVCKRLVEAQSGRVWARPRRGGGLEVSFALPVYGEGSE